MMKGLPKSGKTTWARKWASEKHNRIRVSWTDMMQLMGPEFRKEKQTLAFDAALRLMRNALRQDMDVVLDECNLYGPEYGIFAAYAQQARAKIVWQTMDTPLEVCLQRNKEAGSPLLDEQIVRLNEKWGFWLKQRR